MRRLTFVRRFEKQKRTQNGRENRQKILNKGKIVIEI